MTDILKRLRDGAESAPSDWVEALFTDAAAEIERLRAALEEIEFHGGPAGAVARQVLGTNRE